MRPDRTSSTICRRNSAAYGGLDFGIADTSSSQQDRCPRNRGNSSITFSVTVMADDGNQWDGLFDSNCCTHLEFEILVLRGE